MQAKIEEISISWAILLGFLRSPVSAIQCEANKSNCRCEQRPIGSIAVKCWGTCRASAPAAGRARSRAAYGGGKARSEVRARMHNLSILCQGSSRTIGCVMAHSKTRPARGEALEGEISIIESMQWVNGFSRSLGSATSNKANKSGCSAQSGQSPCSV